MQNHLHFYIDGNWVSPETPKTIDVIDPSTEKPFARISLGSKADVDKAVKAARRAFETFSQTTREERIALFERIIAVYETRYAEIAEAISREMGAPLWLSKGGQVRSGTAHFTEAVAILKNYQFSQMLGTTAIVKEPIGVCGLITPWNWPINQIACKVAPALAAGCTIVLKPSEVSPIDAILFAEVLHEAGVPAGVFNLVNGDGPTVGEAIARHPGVDMVSFTGSTRAGIAVAKAAADTVKRVSQELGGKSANIVLDDAELSKAVSSCVKSMMVNSGQSCNAPSRLFVPRSKHAEAVAIAKATAEKVKFAEPMSEAAEAGSIGPVANETQFNRIQALIKEGIAEGATLVTGGLGRPDAMTQGFYVKPTIFADVKNDMTIAREEIFGPVLTILPYDTQEDAIRMANDTVYGLSGYVQSSNVERAREVASKLRTGNVHINGARGGYSAPFGGYKQSGNGRECGVLGFEEFLETKAVLGYEA